MSDAAQKRDPAPLYGDTQALCEWLLHHLGDDQRALPLSLCRLALALQGAINLALLGRRRDARIEAAEEHLIILRGQLRLAATLGYLTEEQLIHVLSRTDTIGRQLGGWRRSMVNTP